MVDLHLHSLYSDGSFSPTYVMNLAHRNNVSIVSLTDHDCIMGLTEARSVANKLGMIFINGIECECDLSIEEATHIHVLAYNVKDLSSMSNYLETLRSERLDLINRYISYMQQEQNLNIELDDVKNLTPGIHLTANHILLWLVKNGIYHSFYEAKLDYLLPSSPHYLPKKYHIVEDVIRFIRKCGGIPVLAHPYRIGYSDSKLDSFVGHLKSLGLQGIEAYYATHSQAQIDFLLHLANKYDLIVTAGSDWHDYENDILPGIKVPDETKFLKQFIF